MTKPKTPAAKPPRPRAGGSFIRDPKTGELTPEARPEPALPPAGDQQQEG